ncbi:hypothetical protein [Kineosporia babensis]|uniref:Uncharacterized protein n=1 Tax=Kineosporia babensis TaxID=499548 RepID=A0A9X1NBS6_9ACTN|nr:hypothetical protein [Kineosporia babensis]MCD5310876.1 hypothetical protein [Kineosporia babensis]
MTTTADRENAANLATVTPLVWRVENKGRVMFGGEALTPAEFEKRMCFDPDDPEHFMHATQADDDPSMVGIYPDTWNGRMNVTWYRGTTLAQDLAGESEDVYKAGAHRILYGDANGYHHDAPTRREIAILAAKFTAADEDGDVAHILNWVMGWADAPELPERDEDDEKPETPDDREEQEWKIEQMRRQA